MYGDDPEDHYEQASYDGCAIVAVALLLWVVIAPFFYYGG